MPIVGARFRVRCHYHSQWLRSVNTGPNHSISRVHADKAFSSGPAPFANTGLKHVRPGVSCCRYILPTSNLHNDYSVFGEDALVNVSVEKKDDNDGKLAGYIRIRSKTQGIALSLGDRITSVQRGLTEPTKQ